MSKTASARLTDALCRLIDEAAKKMTPTEFRAAERKAQAVIRRIKARQRARAGTAAQEGR